MREIKESPEPTELTQWRENTPGIGYRDFPSGLYQLVKAALIKDQRGLCAYTGIGIASRNAGERSHIEHLLPQDHCTSGEDLAYANMVACYPAPGAAYVPYGAVRKGNWPSPAEFHLFVSPRSSGCEERFSFNLQGKVSAARPDDAAANETIRRLGLDHTTLTAMRREAIGSTLEIPGRGPSSLDTRSAKRRLARLQRVEDEGGRLEPFCFVLKQALVKHIQRLEAIRQAKRKESKAR